MAAYTTRQLALGIAIASMSGAVLAILAMTLGTRLELAIIAMAGGPAVSGLSADTVQGLLALSSGLLIFGLPLALVLGLPVGLLLVRAFNLRNDPRIARFALAGAVAALLISLLGTVVVDTITANKNAGGLATITDTRWGRTVTINGVRTAFGWWVEIYLTLRFVAIGAVAGLIARLTVGPPRARA
jgi:hypothetical protein